MGDSGAAGGGGSTERRIHPLRKKEIRSIQNWGEWRRLWEAAETWQEMVGLLHVGFTVGTYNREGIDWEADRLIFYLDHAHDFRSFYAEKDKPLRSVGEKAWRVFCDWFIREANKDEREKHWLWHDVFEKERVFDRLVSFFADSDNLRSHWFDNDSDFRAVEVKKFLIRFIDYTWRKFDDDFYWDIKEDRYGTKGVSMKLFKSRPQLLSILYHLCQLDFLLRENIEVDEASMVELKAIALGGFGGSKTIEEAVSRGNKVAEIYTLLKVKQAELQRQEAVRQAESVMKEAAEKLAKLTKPASASK